MIFKNGVKLGERSRIIPILVKAKTNGQFFSNFIRTIRINVLTFLFVGLDDKPPPLGVVLGHLEPACMVDELDGSDGFGSEGDDGGAVINGDG